MPTLRLDKVSLSFGLSPLLDRVDLQVRKGERVCLLGRNGEGKSSLLRLISRQISADSGEVWIRPGTRVAMLDQDVAADSDDSVLDVVRSGTNAANASMSIGKPTYWSIRSFRGCDSTARRACRSVRRLAPARAARARAGRGARSAVARRADQSPRHRGDRRGSRISCSGLPARCCSSATTGRSCGGWRRASSNSTAASSSAGPAATTTTCVQKRAALEVEARHAALFDKKLAQEEVWIRQGVEARRTRNEGRVRALEELRRQRRRAAGSGRSASRRTCRRRRARANWCSRRDGMSYAVDGQHAHRGLVAARDARRPHRHHRPERLRQDHADQAAGRRARSPPPARSVAAPGSSRRTSTSSATSSIRRPRSWTTSPAAAATR